jgi:luciferase-type oxidoreductase
MDLDFEGRGEAFRTSVDWMQRLWQGPGVPWRAGVVEGLDLLPRPVQARIPMLMAGGGQQTPDWIAQHLQGRFAYPESPDRLAARIADWRQRRWTLGRDNGIFVSAMHLDLAEDPAAPMQPFRFGGRIGRQALAAHLHAMAEAGLDHLALLLRPSRRPVEDVIEELACDILPAL